MRRIDASKIEPVIDLLRRAGGPDALTATTADIFRVLHTLAVTSHRNDQPRFIIVDQIPRPDLGWQLFGRMRDDPGKSTTDWPYSIAPDEIPHYTMAPADTFFPTLIHIDRSSQQRNH